MKQLKNSFSLLSRLSDAFLPLILILIAIPFLGLLILGVVFLYEKGYLYFLIAWTLVSFAVFGLYKWINRRIHNEKELASIGDGILVEPSGRWSDFDNKVWMEINGYIDQNIKAGIGWGEIQIHTMEIISSVAQHYNPTNSEKEFAFSINELLLALEEVSRRYRRYIHDNIPFSDKISLSLLKKTYNHKDKLKNLEYAHYIYRVARFSNPAAALISEMRGLATDTLFTNLSDSLQDKLKIVLLKEVASVAIDLYSGNFKVEDCDLLDSQVSVRDKERQAIKIEPLRVVVVGQTGAGKSSVINALVEKMVAEVSVIPSTDKIAVYECKIDDIEMIRLVDSPGLDGSIKTEETILNEMVESDLIIWVVKAAQSARKLDRQLRDKFDEFYKKSENRSRIKPKTVLIVNQVDKLQPIAEWSPPYDLIDCDASDKKACIIRDAVKYNQEILTPDDILALSIKPDEDHFNLNELKAYLVAAYSDGVNTQLNRRRLEYDPGSFREQMNRFGKLAKQLYGL